MMSSPSRASCSMSSAESCMILGRAWQRSARNWRALWRRLGLGSFVLLFGCVSPFLCLLFSLLSHDPSFCKSTTDLSATLHSIPPDYTPT
ncbi:unnamed protein product [Chondrus crispus]|uniref:Uncharacterized protein n=1 Tax=Chondrus crispus TaxID=2769 RepID=R7QU71_CHOCR|nr:unnamed protein product [Chondrus crispus]CDF41011.1 unnamed protein product [Chondrus crispus]|eukprot:XP_005711305.1 unnamed protein product [Chondrus crispus]